VSLAAARYLEQWAPHYAPPQDLAPEHRRWIQRGGAESALSGNTGWLHHLEGLLAETEATLALREREIEALRGSATWRWSQRVLRNPVVRRVFGRFIRAVAQRSQPR
jgi:hypothetical protein